MPPYSLVPERELNLGDSIVPKWKYIWNSARRLTRIGDYSGAIQQYERLLSIKKQLEEARWELAKIHLHLKHWDEASLILELLLEAEPERASYINALGRVVWEKGQFDRAVDLFQKSYELDKTDVNSIAGLVEGLIKLDRKQEAFPVLEALHRLQPDNLGIQRYLAILAYDLSFYEKARKLLITIAEQNNVDNEVLLKTARVHEKLQLPNSAEKYWQRLVIREPDNIEAHTHLADFLEETGRWNEALPHFLFLIKQYSENSELYLRTGRIYENLGYLTKALPYYNKYLKSNPDNHEILRAVVKIQSALGNKKGTLAALDNYFKSEPDSQPDDLKLAARLYDAAGRYNKAIPLYMMLFDISPQDPEILSSLANDLLAIGENEGALSMWRLLAEVVDEPLNVYVSMADLLERLDRTNELIEILEAIHVINPSDNSNTMKLASLYLKRGDYKKAGFYFEHLAKRNYTDADFFLNRGKLNVHLKLYEKAIKDFTAFLNDHAEDYPARILIIRLAGELGMIGLASEHLVILENNLVKKINSTHQRLEYHSVKADLLKRNGFYDEAIKEYQQILDYVVRPVSETEQYFLESAWLGIASSYQEAGLYFEADQTLRSALITENNRVLYVSALVELNLKAGNLSDAEAWLYELGPLTVADNIQGRKSVLEGWQVDLLSARLLKEQGENRAAYKIYQHLYNEFIEIDSAAGKSSKEKKAQFVVGLHLVNFLLDGNRLKQAEKVCRNMIAKGNRDLEVFALLRQILRKAQKRQAEIKVVNSMKSIFWNGNEDDADLENLLRLSSLYSRYGNLDLQENYATTALIRAPYSLQAQFFLADAQKGKGQMKEALKIYKNVLKHYPENTKVQVENIKILAKLGRNGEALASCNTLKSEIPRSDILLINARILWTNNQKKEAVAIYKSFLEPPVNKLLAEQLTEHGLTIDLLPQKTLWHKITFSEGKPPELAEVIMSPAYVVDYSPESMVVNGFAAPMYSLYKWQEKFSNELDARQSYQQRQYNQAASQYEILIRETEVNEPLLFDLAGLYGRLGKLGEEAVIYEQLEDSSPEFPGLDHAIQRNYLKRRPQLTASYGLFEDNGWNNQKAVKEQWAEIDAKFSPGARHSIDISASRRNYHALNIDDDLYSRRLLLSYNNHIRHGLIASVDFGVEQLDKDIPRSDIYSFSMLGKIGDTLTSRVSFSQDITTDTTASLRRNILHRDFEAGFSADFFPRVIVGADYAFQDYTDDNSVARYTLWSSYIFFFEPTFLKFNFHYDFEDSKHGPSPGIPLEDGFARYDHPYYTPIEYWMNRFSIYFKHQFSEGTIGLGLPQYYTVEYTWGYDSLDDDLEAVNASFFLELEKNFILKGTAGFSDLKSHETKSFLLSLVYRW